MSPVEASGGMSVERNVYVTMRDGVRLAIDIYRPAISGKIPVLLAQSPYSKDMQTIPVPFPMPAGDVDSAHKTAPWDGCVEAGDTNYILAHGYAHVIADIRGMGYSEGEAVGFNPVQEGEDGYDLVEWLAQQPWCDGNVGGVGMSNFGMSQVRTALQKPPHLKSIAPFFYHPDIPPRHGILPSYMVWLYHGHDSNSGYSPQNVVSALQRRLDPVELERLVELTLENNPELRYDSRLFKVLRNPAKNPILFDQMIMGSNPEYFGAPPVPGYNELDIPILMGGFQQYAGFHLYKEAKGPKKLICWSAKEYEPRPWRTGIDQVIRWHDHWLKGIDTGMLEEEPISLFIQGTNKWRTETEWPLTRTQYTPYYLRSWERLTPEPEIPNEFPDCYLQEPSFVSVKRGSLEYLSEPLSDDMEVTGCPVVYLHASIDQANTNWRVQISDVDLQGKETTWPKPLSEAWLRATHRELDESLSTEEEPILTGIPKAVVPGEIYEYAFLLPEMLNTFKAGHRIKLSISSMNSWKDPDAHTGDYVLSICQPTLHKIYRDDEHRSRVLLPVIPATDAGLTAGSKVTK